MATLTHIPDNVIDLARAVEDKLQIIFGRPFREDREPGDG